MISRLSTRFGIGEKAFEWVVSYLWPNTACPSDIMSKRHPASVYCILLMIIIYPTTSMLTIRIFTSYSTRTVQLTCSWHNVTSLIHCVQDIDKWMVLNKLKRNTDKSELIMLASPYQPRPSLNLCTGNEEIRLTPKVRNIGTVFDEHFSMASHVAATCKSSFFHLCNIAKNRKYLTQDTCRLLICSTFSKLD